MKCQQKANASRADDETLLAWLHQRASGVSSSDIANRYGVTATRVRTATNRVMQADMEESGESGLAGKYWGAGS